MTMTVTPVYQDGLKIRLDHNTSATQVGSLPYGTSVEVSELWPVGAPANTEQWARIGAGWVAVFYGKKLANLVGTLPEPDPVVTSLPIIYLHAEGYPDVEWKPNA